MVQDIRISTDAPQGQSPLLRFKGNLVEYKMETREYDRDDGSKRQASAIVFNIKDVEVLEATEPYPFPTATINIPYAPPATSRGGTRWEVFAKSLRGLMPDVDGAERLNQLIGQTQEWAQLPGLTRARDAETGQWGEVETKCWQVVSVDGIAAPEDLTDYITGIADGKTEQAFHQALMTDSKIISRPDLVTSITERKLLSTLELAGKVSRDSEGILHRAQ